MNRNFNFSETDPRSDAEETANNSFGDKETKELLYSYNLAICQIREAIEAFKKSQVVSNETIKQERRLFKKEIKLIKNQMSHLSVYKDSHDRKMDHIDKEILKEKEVRNLNPSSLHHNPNLLTEYVNCFSKSVTSMKSPNEQIGRDFNELKKDLITLYGSKDDIIEMLRNTNKNLEEMNAVLATQLLTYEEENNRMKFCIKCHQNFSNKDKDEINCIFHPGELKYYSCKTCGADEYFTCCSKCKKCSIGCKKSKHTLAEM